MLKNFIKMRNRSLPSEAPNFFGDGAAAKIIVDHLSRRILFDVKKKKETFR